MKPFLTILSILSIGYAQVQTPAWLQPDSVIHDLYRVLPADWIIFRAHDGFELYKINFMKQEKFEKSLNALLNQKNDTTHYFLDDYPPEKEDVVRQHIRSAWADSVFYSTGLSPDSYSGKPKKPENKPVNGIVCLQVRFGNTYDSVQVGADQRWNDSLSTIYSTCFKKGSRDGYYYLDNQFDDYRYWVPRAEAANQKCGLSLAKFRPVPYRSSFSGQAVFINDQRKSIKDRNRDTDDLLVLIRAYLLLRLGIR